LDFFWIVLFSILVLIILSLSSDKANAQTTVFGQSDFVTYRKDSSFSIRVPDYLIPVNDLDARASLQFKNIFNETYMLVVPELKSADGHLDLIQLENHFKSNLSFKGGRLTDQRWIKIGNCTAFQNEAEWTVEGEPLAYLITFIDTPGTLYKIYCWTLAGQKEYLNDFKQAANSFALSVDSRSIR